MPRTKKNVLIQKGAIEAAGGKNYQWCNLAVSLACYSTNLSCKLYSLIQWWHKGYKSNQLFLD